MNLLKTDLFEAYNQQNVVKSLENYFKLLDIGEEVIPKFLFESSAVFSSNIEGNTLDLNSFLNGRGKVEKSKQVEEIEDLAQVYEWAKNNPLTEKNLLDAHKRFSKSFVSEGNCGVYRNDKVGVFSSKGLEYMAVEFERVEELMHQLFKDIASVVSEKRTVEEAFFFASFAHLVFAHIHPFSDGNGRAGRLLEKWILSTVLGEKTWSVTSEEFYKLNRPEYYKNINLGVNFYELDYSKALPFLLMLPSSVKVPN